MQAKETKLQEIIEGTKQFVIPLFQRTYSWTAIEWNILWKDLIELCEMDHPRTHFFGSIVTMQIDSNTEGITKYILIDGQQRLTTVFVFLALLRNRVQEHENQEIADEIHNTLLVNQYKKGNDFYKLMPTQIDRQAYYNVINGLQQDSDHSIAKCYIFFEKKLKQNSGIDHKKLSNIITNYFSIVSITLNTDDNPYLVFESLNAKGMPLTQADLIRNYFFMRIEINEQNIIYEQHWAPMYKGLDKGSGDNVTEFIRHYLMKDGGKFIRQDDIYQTLKERVSAENAAEYLKDLHHFSAYYQRIKFPKFEPDKDLQRLFSRLNRIEVTTAYPLLLNFYKYYVSKKITRSDFISLLKTLENYLIRRFVCNIATNQLSKNFSSICASFTAHYPDAIIDEFKSLLQSKEYPKDKIFGERFRESKLYGTGARGEKTKLILETIEDSYAHKELISYEKLTIEHVMPQTPSDWWKKELGNEWEEIHDSFLHTTGNLTLTAYNAEISNADFPVKKSILAKSHLEINKYFLKLSRWTQEEIEKRAEELSKKALEIWPYLGERDFTPEDVTRTTPYELVILGQHFPVKSWRDVLEKTFNVIADDLESEQFEVLAQNFPSYISKDKDKFKEFRQLNNGYFIKVVSLSARIAKRICSQAIETLELSSDNWIVRVH
ncbi:hypothetical protein FACS1894172_00580 [Spirochaetia bacterium]|nr:hypothetical protein FACS1894164_07370 [Spirochaetia bacterium]GHU29442.1 hypothetical protein FACS1894172_00580 [Spirochaetia bacterium]